MRVYFSMIAFMFGLGTLPFQAQPKPIIIGSKTFTESVILGEMATAVALSSGLNAVHQREIGGTRPLWSGLLNGDIDLYAEYTGTLQQEIFSNSLQGSSSALSDTLEKLGLRMSKPLGFNKALED
jgi:osmoprotectant transport system permease protein